MQSYQGIFLTGTWPRWETLVVPGLWALGFLAFGYFVFSRLQHDMVDEL